MIRFQWKGMLLLAFSWLLIVIVGCSGPLSLLQPPPTPTPAPPRAELAAMAFLRTWERGEFNALYDQLSSASHANIGRDELVQQFRQAYQDAAVTAVDLEMRSVLQKGEEAQVAFHLTYNSAAVGPFEADNILSMTLEGDRWLLNWSPGLVWPEFRPGSHFHIVEKRPSRGNIYDRNGLGLAVEGLMVTVGVVPEQIQNEAATVVSLSRVTGLPPQDVRDKIGRAKPNWFVPLKDVPVETYQQHAPVLENLPGVVLRQSFARSYSGGPLAAHLVGYLGSIQEEELESWTRKGYRGDEWIGQAGLERWSEDYLTGRKGGVLTVVNAQGQTVSTVAERVAQPSRNVYSTIDRTLQAGAQMALGDRIGAIVALDPRNGQVLAMVSSPSFDPNQFVGEMHPATWQNLLSDPHRPLLNRAVQGTYPPASIFKIITTSAALEVGGYAPESPFMCNGVWFGLGSKWAKTCWLRSGHGAIDLSTGLTGSCDVVFYEIGKHLHELESGPNILSQYARGFGLGSVTGLEGFGEAAGLVPDAEWKAQNLRESWYPGDTVNMAIGQGYVLVTPIQMAVTIAAVANGGTLYRPQAVLKVDASGEEPETRFPALENGRLHVKAENLLTIQRSLLNVTSGPRGTAVEAFAGFPIPVAGKTGTAEHAEEEPHSWFIGYAPADNPQIAIAVLVEEGGEGSKTAAPIFRRVVETYFDIEPPTPTPTSTVTSELTVTPVPTEPGALPVTD